MIRLGMIKESVSMSVSNIKGNRMRSFLTILGIVIGVAAIIALITIVEGVTSDVTAQFEALGAGKLTVNITGTPLKRGLTGADIEEIKQVANVADVSPSLSVTAAVLCNGIWEDSLSVEGLDDIYFKKTPDIVGRGREINILDVDNANRVCLIDKTLIDKMFYGIDPLGQTMRIAGIAFEVVGTLSADDSDVMAQMNASDDGRVIIPYTTAMKLSGQQNIRALTVYMAENDKSQDTIDGLEQVLKPVFNNKDNTYRVINMQSLLDTMNTMMSLMTGLLGGIASIALLVGGIGIMNMMLVSVTERTTEIGLRKALGAEPGQIQLQFLIESFLLSMLGGFVGLVLGISISYVFSMVLESTFKLSPSAMILGVGFSASVGIVFGWAPARKASNLNPIDALRSV